MVRYLQPLLPDNPSLDSQTQGPTYPAEAGRAGSADSGSWIGGGGEAEWERTWHLQDLAGSADDGLPCQQQRAQSGGPMSDEETHHVPNEAESLPFPG